MKKSIISTELAPKAIGPYSQAVRAGNLLFISGQIPLNPLTGAIEGNTIEAQTQRVLANVCAILASESIGPENVVKVTIFIRNMSDFPIINEIYGQTFTTNPPARETVEVSRLPKDALIEISAVALYP